MKILVIGGTRFFGIHMVNELFDNGHDVTIATRGKASDQYGDSVKNAISGTHYDVVIDNIA